MRLRVSAATFVCLMCLPPISAYCGSTELVPNSAETQTDTNTSNLVTYLQNLGSYLGFNITAAPASNYITTLLDVTGDTLAQTLLYNTFLGAIPVALGGANPAFSFVPTGASLPPINLSATSLNNLQNTVFSQYRSTSASTQQSPVTVSSLIDQQSYQPEPVSQALLNILSTPDVSYCMTAQGLVSSTTTSPSCGTLINQNQVLTNVIGPLPDANQFFSPSYTQTIISQLNSNALLAPLYYSSDNTNTSSSSTTTSTAGLTAQSQAQQAANFVRYASGLVSPVVLPSKSAYSAVYQSAVSSTNNTAGIPAAQMQAQAQLSSYLLSLRIYAAQASVGIGNLYYILAKRLPQTATSSGTGTTTSQALSEYYMATWRVFQQQSSTGSNTNQWVANINTASPATVQKEIAILLSEISYQMYLDRQIQERMLLTQSVSLLQATRAIQPNPDIGNQQTSAPITPSAPAN